MGDVGMISREQSLSAAFLLLRELEANDSLTDDMKKILADIDCKLSASMKLSPEEGNVTSMEGGEKYDEVREQLKISHEKIMSWESNPAMIIESGQELVSEYIEAVEEVLGLVWRYRGSKLNEFSREIISQGEDVLQVAMARLEEELIFILVSKRQVYEHNGKVDDDGSEGVNSTTELPRQSSFTLIKPEVIPYLESIKKCMFAANYDQEFCGAYTKTQKEALEDCLIGLGMETLSIEELLRLDWKTLDSKIKAWVQLIKTVVQVYLRAEKLLCDRAFGESGTAAQMCFVDITKSTMVCLLNFGNAMALGPHTPEKLFNLLDMYEVLAELQGEINTLFAGGDGSLVRAEFHEVMERLRESAKTTFLGFGNMILSDPSTDPFPGGGVHPLSSYVMNYIIVYLPDYCKILKLLLPEDDAEVDTEDSKCLLACQLRSTTEKLKSNLEKKSQLYKDPALQHVFLMNNIHYIQHKVMDSELRQLFGDKWIRTQIVIYQQHATSYVRSTWSSVVAALRDDGIPSGSGSGVKAILKEKIRLFSVAFEEVYRNQSGWIIREKQLKDELRISISQKVILAYQSFIGRHSKYDIEKYVKYDTEALEELLMDFFEGSQKSLHYSRRR